MIVIGAVVIYWALLPRAEVIVRIVNTRDVSAEYELKMDGDFLQHGYIPANQHVLQTFSVVLDSRGCEQHTISGAISRLGLRGEVYSETVTLCPGEETPVSLGD